MTNITDFLTTLFQEGKQVSTVRNYRSAIASIHKGFNDGTTVGSNPAIVQLLRGMFNSRPPRRRLPPSWSINDVLNSLRKAPYEPMHNAPLELLTKKTLFLLATASARRRSEIHALTTRKGFIRFDPQGVHLLPNPDFMTKNEAATFSPEAIFLPSLAAASSIREDRLSCPVRALKWYMERTKPVRSSDKLFLVPRSPYNPASKDTLSRWLVEMITPFADKDDQVRAHSIRAQSTSKAWFRGVPLQDILKAAAWKTPSSFVSCYLTDVVSADAAFARAVLQGPGPSSSSGHPPGPNQRC